MTRRLNDKNMGSEADALKQEAAKRKHAEAQLQKALDNFNAIFENSPDALMIIDAIKGEILKANQMVTLLFGYKASELKGKNFKILFPANQDKPQKENLQEPPPLESVFTQQFRCADGSMRYMDMTSSIIKMDHGISILAAFRDISKRVRMEKKLRESRQKHLQFHRLVRLITDHASDYIWAKDQDRQYIFVNRTMCENLLNRNDPEEAIGKSEAFFIKPVKARKPLKSDDKTAHEDQSIAEPLDKPVKYLKEGVINDKYFAMDVHESPIFNEKRQIIGTVGIGRDITARIEIQKRETPDKVEKQRDASLSTYRNIIQDFKTLVDEISQMIVMAQSESKSANSVRRRLQKALELAQQSSGLMERFRPRQRSTAPQTTREDASKCQERILFVDIEEAGAEVSKQILEHLGYQTEAGSDPEKALDEFRSCPNDFDLVITDMTLPKMSGETLATEILKIRPDIPIIFCTTGYTHPQKEMHMGVSGIAATLVKPLVMSEIASTVRNVLDKRNMNA